MKITKKKRYFFKKLFKEILKIPNKIKKTTHRKARK